jgi:hypothetical protein
LEKFGLPAAVRIERAECLRGMEGCQESGPPGDRALRPA